MVGNKTFGKFKQELTAGNKTYHVYHSGDVDGKTVTHYTRVNAYNRDEAHAHASKVFKKKQPNVKNISVDHIGLEELKEENEMSDKKMEWEAEYTFYKSGGKPGDYRDVKKIWKAYTEQEAKEKAKLWLDGQKDNGKLLKVKKLQQSKDTPKIKK